MNTKNVLLIFLSSLFVGSSAQAGENVWTQTSEGMFGGRVIALAISPDYAKDQTMFAAMDIDGGVYKSIDGGETWVWVYKDIPVYIKDIIVSPNFRHDRTVFFAADLVAGGLGSGVYRTNDSGASWELWVQSSGPVGMSSFAISPNFAEDRTLWIVGPNSHWQSVDGGLTWTQGDHWGSYQLVFSPDYVNDRILFRDAGRFVAKSTDGGKTWIYLRNGLDWSGNRGLSSIAISSNFAADSTLFAGGNYGIGAYKSTDGGRTWFKVNINISGNSWVEHIVVSPSFAVDQTVFVVTTDEGIFKSADAGQSWILLGGELLSTVPKDIALSPNYENDAIIFAGTLRGMFLSQDGGLSWTRKNYGLTHVDVFDIDISPAFQVDSTIFAGTDFGLFKSLDAGKTWVPIGLTDLWVWELVLSPNYANDHTLFVSTDGGVFKSTDEGYSWTLVQSGRAGGLVISPNYPDDHTLFMCFEGAGVFKSIDEGSSWVAVNNGLTNLDISEVAISPNYANDQTLFAGTYFSANSGVFRSTHGGASWMEVGSGTFKYEEISSFAFSPDYANDQTLFVGTSYILGGGVFKSTDGGNTWTRLRTAHANTVALSPDYPSDKTVYVGAGFGDGILKSTDAGTHWATFNLGLPHLYVGTAALVISPTYPHTLFANGSGVWQYTPVAPSSRVTLKIPTYYRDRIFTFVDLQGDTLATMRFINAPDSATVEAFADVHPPAAPAGSKSVKRYYGITMHAYWFGGPIRVEVSLYYKQSEFDESGLFAENNLKLYRYSTNQWELLGGAADPMRNRVTVYFEKFVQGQPDFSLWAFADPSDHPVPVELATFEATVNETSVLLAWSTASESNNLGFEVQRSQDKLNFTKIGYVAGNETTATPHSYTYIDCDLAICPYYYRLKQIDTDGSFEYSGIVQAVVGLPKTFELSQNYPNPFNPVTTIKYQLPKSTEVSLKIYNLLGQLVRTLVDEKQVVGYYSIHWDGKDDRGRAVASGVYLYSLRTKEFVKSRKMIIVR